MNSDILSAFEESLRVAGLVVEHVRTDGHLHRCGTTDRPRGTDGAYRIHLDAPACCWWKNWRTGDEGSRTTKPEKDLTPAERKPLRALVGSWAQVSGLPFAACWNQLKAAFNLANIKELPQEWIPDALAWVQARIDALPAQAQAAAPLTTPLPAPTDDAEGHLAAIREHIRQIHRHEEALFLLARKALPPVRTAQDMYSPARRTGLNALQSMEDCSGALHHNLRVLESAARAMLG